MAFSCNFEDRKKINMLKIKIEKGKEYQAEDVNKLNGELLYGDWVKLETNKYHVIYEYKSYSVEVVEANFKTKLFALKINGELFKLSVKDEHDQLLESLGMDHSSASKLSDVKAPMPGMVLDVIVKDGNKVNKGDSLLILEAMKMENILKSPGEGLIKQIKIRKGDKVEKNQVLILFA
jgi:biotin carboxyl carrier protein